LFIAYFVKIFLTAVVTGDYNVCDYVFVIIDCCT